MELFGVLLIGAGVVMLLGYLGVLRSPGGGSSASVDRLTERVMQTNKNYPVRDFSIRQTQYGPEVQVSYPLNNFTPEPYGGMDADAMAEELRRMGGNGPGPNHPG